MALQIRRGTNQERLGITLVEGEIVYITDSQLVTIEVTSIDISTDVLTTTLNHGLSVNDQILFMSDNANGLTEGQVYFVKTIPSQTDFTLSTSLGGATLNITGVTGAVSLSFAVGPTDGLGVPYGYSISPLWVGDDVTVGGNPAGVSILADLADVEIGVYGNVGQHGEALENNDVLQYNDATNHWENRTDMTLNGDIAVNGGDVTTTSTTGNLFNANATTVNIGNGATVEVNLGAPAAGRVQVKSEFLDVNGGVIRTTQANANIFNENATTVNIGNGATTEVNLGSLASGRVQVKSPLLETVGDIQVNGGDITTPAAIGNLFNTTTPIVNIGNGATTEVNLGAPAAGRVQIKSEFLDVNGGVIRTSNSFGNIFNENATVVNLGNGATTEVNVGSPAGGSRVQIKPETIVGSSTTQAVFNTVATTVNAFGAATAVNMGDAAGIVTVAGDLAVNGGDLTTTSANANLFNTNATDINIGNSSLITRLGAPGVTNTVLIKPGILVGEGTTQAVFNTVATTVNAFGAATAVNIGDAAGTVTVAGDLAVNGGDITTTNNTGNLFNNDGVTVVNVGNGATTEVNLGAPGAGRVQIKSPELDVNGNATITGNLTVNGTTTNIDTVNLVIEDNIITINKNQTGTPSTSLRSGFEVERGDSANTIWQWNELNKWWEAEGGAGSTEQNIWAAGAIIAGGTLATNGNDIFFNNADSGSGATSSIVVRRGSNADVAFRWNETSDRWESTTDGSTYIALPNQALDTGNNPVFAGVTGGNVRVGISSDNEIDTITGALTLTSATAETNVTGTLTSSGTITATNGTVVAGKVRLSSDGVSIQHSNLSSIGTVIRGMNVITTTSTTPTDMNLGIISQEYASIDFTLQARKGNEWQVVKGMLLIDSLNSNTFLNIYSDLRTGASDLFSVSANIDVTNDVELLVTSSSADSTKYSGHWIGQYTPN
jgi:hypothetical protein